MRGVTISAPQPLGEAHFLDASTYDPPSAIWDRTWTATRFMDDGKDRSIERLPGGAGPVEFAFVAAGGRVTVTGCNGAGGLAHIDGDVLVKDGDWPVTLTACTAEDLIKQDAWIEGLLSSRPTIEVRSDRLTVTTGDGRRMELTLLPGGDEAPPGDPATTTTTTDGLVATTAPETTVPESTVSAQPPSTTTTTVPGPTVPAKPPSTTTITDGSGGGSADGFFGYEWHVVSVAGEGANREFRGAVVDTRTAGVVTISGCNGAGGAMRLEGDRLVKNGDWAHTAMACLPTGDGEDLMAQDAWYEAFLTDGPTVAAPPGGVGSAIILDTGTATVHLERP